MFVAIGPNGWANSASRAEAVKECARHCSRRLKRTEDYDVFEHAFEDAYVNTMGTLIGVGDSVFTRVGGKGDFLKLNSEEG